MASGKPPKRVCNLKGMAAQATVNLDRIEAAIETLLAFVNTRNDGKGGRVERFGNATDFADWARERKLIGDDTVSESEAAAARELRAALVSVLQAHSGHAAMTEAQLSEAERHLAHAAELYPVRITLSAAGSSVGGQNRGAAGVFGRILAAANEIAAHDAWWRMKACCSRPCLHGFADRTKNGAQRYCNPRCASRAAMRAMRERRREEAAR
jgi:predicted RNA-binding Zn ribbon-like protein